MAGGSVAILIEPDTKDFPGKLQSGLKSTTGIASKVGKGIALALAAGTAAAGFGLAAVIDKGKAYEANLNELQAVSQATALDMRKVGDTAKALGADMSLPATSAADAAAAMVELAKGGLSVDEAMQAAKGTLQLAAAAQVDGATAAEIQSSALNSFGLAADQAGRVADVLANTANAAAGSIVDIGNSMKFVAPVSAALGVSIEDTAAAIGLLANQGVKGEQAGTSLRGILASLASPSAQAKEALEKLGVAAFDAQGKFIGLRAFTDQLAKAKGRLTDAEFAAAASTAFGNEGFTAANALAAEGAVAFDAMATSVSRAGGAADVAAAKTKGLGGAIEGFQSQVETAGIGIFEAIAPQLEKVVRAGADFVAEFTPTIVGGLETAVAAGELFGPGLADALRDRGAVIGDAVHDVLGPIVETIPGLLNAGLNAAIGLWEDFTGVLRNVVDAAKPVANGIADVAKAATQAGGPLSAAGAALGIVGDVARIASGVLVPIGKIVGGIASAFADLPGPVQTAVVALGLIAAFRGPLSSLGDTVTSRVTGPFKSMGEQIRLQQALFDGTSGSIGKFGGALAALESRLPVVQQMRGAFDDAAGGADRFHRSAGLAAAAGTGLKAAAGGLVSFLGGPWGIAIAGASLGLGVLASKQAESARVAGQQRAAIDSVADALRRGGEVAARSELVNRLTGEFKDGAEAAKKFGIDLQDVVNFAVTGAKPTGEFAAKLQEIKKAVESDPTSDLAQSGLRVLQVINGLRDSYTGAIDKNRLLDEAIRNGNVSMLEATGTGRDLASAMAVLKDNTASADDRARALKDALDALSGGEVDLEAAQARLNEQLARLSEVFGENVDKTKGWGAALLNADGSINTTTDNGRRLFDGLRDLSGSMAEVAQRTFDASKETDGVQVALEKAKQSAQATRDEFIKQHTAMGLTAEQAATLADRYGLIPEVVATAIQTPGMTKAQTELILVKSLVDKVPPDKAITIRSLTDEAKKMLEDIGFTVRTLPDGSVSITANTQKARDDLQGLVNDASRQSITIPVHLRVNTAAVSNEIRKLQAGVFAKGGIVAAAYAGGGVHHKLTPMRAGIAQIVPPNTWRIVGDRLRDDEAYIPINQSARSHALLMETARRMGYDMVRRFALGGLATQGQAVARVPSLDGLSITGRLELGTDGLVTLVDGRIRESNRQTRRAVQSGTGGAR